MLSLRGNTADGIAFQCSDSGSEIDVRLLLDTQRHVVLVCSRCQFSVTAGALEGLASEQRATAVSVMLKHLCLHATALAPKR